MCKMLNKMDWDKAGVRAPSFDISAMAEQTRRAPSWVHFGAGNIFRGFIAALQQRLLESEDANCGIIVIETFDPDIINQIYIPNDNMSLNVLLGSDGSLDCEIICSVAEAIALGHKNRNRVKEIFQNPSLQLVSLTVTEKGYTLRNSDGTFLPMVLQDMESEPEKAIHIIGIIAGAIYYRYLAGEYPLAIVSMDNCANNGDLLKSGVLEVAEAWQRKGFTNDGFLTYLNDETKVFFPLSMIDKITPRPDEAVAKLLAQRGIAEMAAVVTSKNTFIAPFVNAERPQYLVIEDKFPAGRPRLEKAGVYFTDRETVTKVERMKVTTCLNPIHTAMSIYGCLLGYTRICDVMNDQDIVALIRRLGYIEGLPVAVDPGILSPKAFLDEVMNERLPNPFIPDTPQRIATDTSQKIAVRFGETIKNYGLQGLDTSSLVAIPLSIAGWLRYLLAKDDSGKEIEVSADPMLNELQTQLYGVVWDDPGSYSGQIRDILKNASIFGSDLTKIPLGDKIEEMFIALIAGSGSVRKTLQKYL